MERLSITVQTLEGHPDAGTNTFTASYDPATQQMTWTTHNISRTNDAALQGAGARLFSARDIQQTQWKNVMTNVFFYMNAPNVISAKAVIREYDYNDWTNEIGEEEEDERIDIKLL